MEKSHIEEGDEPAPPYEESNISRLLEISPPQALRSLTAQEQAAKLCQQRVKLLVDGHVEPLLENAVLHGNSQSIIFIPSDSITTTTVLTTSNLVHRSTTSHAHIVQLQGPNSTAAFWSQSKVVNDLEKSIKGLLYGIDDTPLSTSLSTRPADLSSPTSGQQSSWLERTFGVPGTEHDPTDSTGE